MSTEEKPKIKISDVLDLLAAGQDRKAIRAHYGLTAGQSLELFKHPQLLGRKTIKPIELPFELEDDVTGTARALKAKDEASATTSGEDMGKPAESEVGPGNPPAQEETAAENSTRRSRTAPAAEAEVTPSTEEPAQERSPWDAE